MAEISEQVQGIIEQALPPLWVGCPPPGVRMASASMARGCRASAVHLAAPIFSPDTTTSRRSQKAS